MPSPLQHLLDLPDDLLDEAPPPRKLMLPPPPRILHIEPEPEAFTPYSELMQSPAKLRDHVKLRLLAESEPAMPSSVRLRALEALGKISEVGLFAERTEITIKAMPVDELEAKLRAKLQHLLPARASIEKDIVDV